MSKDYRFTVMQGKKEIVSLDDIKIARQALDETGKGMWIRYNQNGIDLYNHYKDLQDVIDMDEAHLEDCNEMRRVTDIKLFESTNDRTTGRLRSILYDTYALAEELTRDIIFNKDEIKAGGIL